MRNAKSCIVALLGMLCLAMAARAADDGPLGRSALSAPTGVNAVGDGTVLGDISLHAEQGSGGSYSESLRKYLRPCSWGNDCDGGGGCGGVWWTATADVLVLHRSAGSSQLLLQDPLTEEPLLSSGNMEFTYGLGPRISVICHELCGCDVEVNYFGLGESSATADFPNSALPLGFAVLNVDNTLSPQIHSVSFTERSRLYSGELNLRQPIGGWLTPLIGFRWVELDDNYEAEGIEEVALSSFDHTIKVHNRMYGFQVGAELSLFDGAGGLFSGPDFFTAGRGGGLCISGFAKAGIFYNAADQFSEYNNPDGQGDLTASDDWHHAAFLGEAGLIASYHFNNHFAVRGGYQVMWIDGVALAPQQIPFTDLIFGTARIDISAGGLFYHGATAGLEVTW